MKTENKNIDSFDALLKSKYGDLGSFELTQFENRAKAFIIANTSKKNED